MISRRDRVMVACVVTDTVRVSDPVKVYGIDRIHLIHYVSEDSEVASVFKDFYNETVRIIKESSPNCEIVEHDDRKVFVLSEMLTSVESIVEEETHRSEISDIYINISAGTPEYISASTMVSMMHQRAIPIAVGGFDYLDSTIDDLKRKYYHDGRPVGKFFRTKEPIEVQKFRIPLPPEHLVRALRLYKSRCENGEDVRARALIDCYIQ